MRILIATILLATGVGCAAPALAQSSSVEGRVDRLEREVSALQRKVFPGGSDRYFQPEITPAQTGQQAPGTPATGPIVDLDARVTALEQQLRTLTGQVEQAQYRTRQLDDAFQAYKAATDARLKALEGDAPAGSPVSGDSLDTPPAPTRGPGRGNGVLRAPEGNGDDTPAASTAPAEKPAPAKPAATDKNARAQALAAVERPDSGDAAEDSYIYGYRLWAAKLYPEAEAQLQKTVKDYPDSRRASYAQNLLGRAYLDDGQPRKAFSAFYKNVNEMPNGERVPDSLYYMGQALTQLKLFDKACVAYNALEQSYGGQLSDARKAEIAKGREAAKCK